MEKTSYEILKNIQAELSDLSNNLEHQYYKMHEECIKELIKDKQDIVTQKNEMYALYEKIINSETMRMNWIKNKLPWYITKFCKISSSEISLRDTSIFIGVNFGKSSKPNCYIEITPMDIGWE